MNKSIFYSRKPLPQQVNYIESCIQSIPPRKIHQKYLENDSQNDDEEEEKKLEQINHAKKKTQQQKFQEIEEQLYPTTKDSEKIAKIVERSKRKQWSDYETKNLFTIFLLMADIDSLNKKQRNLNLMTFTSSNRTPANISSHMQTQMDKCLKLYDLLRSLKDSIYNEEFINPYIYQKTIQILIQITPVISSTHLKYQEHSKFKDIHQTAMNLLHFFTQPRFEGDQLKKKEQIISNIKKFLSSLQKILKLYRDDIFIKRPKYYKSPVQEYTLSYKNDLSLQFDANDIVLQKRLMFQINQHFENIENSKIVKAKEKIPNQFDSIVKKQQKLSQLAKLQIQNLEKKIDKIQLEREDQIGHKNRGNDRDDQVKKADFDLSTNGVTYSTTQYQISQHHQSVGSIRQSSKRQSTNQQNDFEPRIIKRKSQEVILMNINYLSQENTEQVKSKKQVYFKPQSSVILKKKYQNNNQYVNQISFQISKQAQKSISNAPVKRNSNSKKWSDYYLSRNNKEI